MSVHKFEVGQNVVYVNDYGLCWGVKTITELTERAGQPCYHYEGSDTPWYAVEEKNLRAAAAGDEGASNQELQAKYGFETPQGMLEASLDGDPWEGEV